MRLRAAACLVVVAVACACTGPRERWPDAPVVLISIDTLRADRLGLYGYASASTPVLDAFGGESVVFERALSHYPLTLPSHASMLTGLLPFRHGVRDNIGFTLSEDHLTLAERFRRSGRRTGAAVSAFVLREQTGIGRGFETYDDAIEEVRDPSALGEVQRDGAIAVEALSRWLTGLDGSRPFFAFLHLYEPHSPWAPPPRYARGDPYDGEVSYADELVGRLLDVLRRIGAYDRSIIVITSDHGEGLGDHGEQEHGLFLYDEAMHVPLMLRLPGGQWGGRRVSEAVAQVDLAATLLDLTGVEATGLDGVSLRPALAGQVFEARPVYAETLYPRYHFGWSELYSATDSRFRYVRAPRPELYDLEADPDERNNLAQERETTVAGMASWLEQRVSEVTAPEAVDDDVREALEALGYVGVGGGATVAEASDLADPKDRVGVLESYKEALSLRRAGRDEEAVAALRGLLEEEPRMLDAWETLGVTLARMGHLDEAIEALSEALALDPERAETHLVLARYQARRGNLDVAREHARLAARTRPGRGYEVLAQIEMDAGRPQVAAEMATRSVEADDARVMSHFILGVVAQQQGRCEEALAAFHRAEEAKRMYRYGVVRDLYANQADCLARLGREAEAEQAFLRELEQIPSSVSARLGLAGLYRSQGRDSDARVVLTGLIDATPRPGPDTYWTVVRGLLALGDADAAGRVAVRAAGLFPNDPRFRPGG